MTFALGGSSLFISRLGVKLRAPASCLRFLCDMLFAPDHRKDFAYQFLPCSLLPRLLIRRKYFGN